MCEAYEKGGIILDNLKKNLYRVLLGLNLLVVLSFFTKWIVILERPKMISAQLLNYFAKNAPQKINIGYKGSYSPIKFMERLSAIEEYYIQFDAALAKNGRYAAVPFETGLNGWFVGMLVIGLLSLAIMAVMIITNNKFKAKVIAIVSFLSGLYYTFIIAMMWLFIIRNNQLIPEVTVVKPTFILVILTLIVLVNLFVAFVLFSKEEVYKLDENGLKWMLIGLNVAYLGSYFVKLLTIVEIPPFVSRGLGGIEKTMKVNGSYSLMSLSQKLSDVKQYCIDNNIDVIYQVMSRSWFTLFMVLSVVTILILLFVNKKYSLPLAIINLANATIMMIGFVLFTMKYNDSRKGLIYSVVSPWVLILLTVSIIFIVGVSIALAERNRQNYGYLFIAPFFIMFVTFLIYPIAQTFYFTFTNKTNAIAPFEVIGFDNWARFIQDAQFRQAFVNTWQIWGLNIVLQLGLALILVFIFSDITWKIKWLGFFRTMFYLPNLITLASVAMLFRILLDWKYGPINQSLVSMGLFSEEVNWFASPALTQMWVAIIGAWLWFGNSFLFLMAGVQGISKDYFEAAKVDGANRRQMFSKITLPLLRPIMVYVSITSLIGGMQIFELPQLLTDGLGAPGNSLLTMVLLLYNQYFKYKNMAYASTIAYGLFFVTIAFTLIYYRLAYSNKAKGGVN